MFKKILMVTMSMDIGGAETHILELAIALKNRGFDVYIASNGGAYLPKIREAGIKHVSVPLNNKRISNIVKSKKILSKFIIDEKIDVVHAHARIPMYVCGKIKKQLKKKQNFTYVTTDHANFRKNFIWKILTDWGEKTLAVSEDLKQSLIKDYGVNAKNIKLTVNGVNTERFNADINYPEDLDVLEKCQGKFNILHVSRLSEEASIPIYALINNMEKLLAKKDDVRLIIVGDGTEFQKLKDLANSKNKKLGEEVIHVLGRKTNVNEYIAFSDMMVAISRSALEGMSSEKPVFLAGPYGIIGKLTEFNINEALASNFTCRNTKDYDENIFIDELVHYLDIFDDDDKMELKKNIAFAKEVMTKNYSVNRMTDDAIAIYEEAYNKINALIFGYIGFDNSGDDAIFDILSNSLLDRYKGMNLTAISSSSKKTLMNNKIKRIYSFSFCKILKEIKNADIVIANGGSLLQDSTSSRSLLYYLWIINTAKRHNKHVCMIANGLGPIKENKNKKRVSESLSRVDLITYRDHKSKKLSDELGIKGPHILTTADLVFKYTNDEDCECKTLFEKLKIPDSNIIGVSIRPWQNSDIFSLQMARVCDKIIRDLKVNIVFIPFQKTKRVDDMIAINNVVENMEEKSYVLDEILNYKELSFIISKFDVMIAMRLHSAIYALVNEVPVYGLSYQPKVKVYLEKFNLPYTEDLDNLDENKITKEVKQLVNSKYEVSKKIGEQLSELANKADENIIALCNYIDSNLMK